MKALLLLFLPLFILLGCLEVQSTESISESESSSSSLGYVESVESRESSYSSEQDEMDLPSSEANSDFDTDTVDESSEVLSSSHRTYENTDTNGDDSGTSQEVSSSTTDVAAESSEEDVEVERVFDESLLGTAAGYESQDERLYSTYEGVAQYPHCPNGEALILRKANAVSELSSSDESDASSSSQKRNIPWGYCLEKSDCRSFEIEMRVSDAECIYPGAQRCGMAPEYTFGPLSNCNAHCDCNKGYTCKEQVSCQIEGFWKECTPTCEILGCPDGKICDGNRCVTACEMDDECSKGEFCGESGTCKSFGSCEGPVA